MKSSSNKISSKCKGCLIPTAEDRVAFIKKCAITNRILALVILSLALAMECFMLLIYILRPYITDQATFFPQYIYMYVTMILVAPCFIFLLHVYRDSPATLVKLEYAVLFFLNVWSGIFSSFDVINGFSSYLFIQIMIITSVGLRLRPLYHCCINAFGLLVYAVSILSGGIHLTILFAEIINPLLMVIGANAVIIYNYQSKYKSYLNQELINDQHALLEYYANYDFLTKIPNRKSIIEHLQELLSAKTERIGCMMIDIDNFKLYNDTYGHITGDECLIKLAAVMESFVLRQGGRIGRYGGEEFFAVFTDKEEGYLLHIANELVSLVRNENIDFVVNSKPSMVTISIGVFFYNSDKHADQKQLLGCADSALYKAKNEGKNRVCLYDNESSCP